MHVYCDAGAHGTRGAWSFISLADHADIAESRGGTYDGTINHIGFGLWNSGGLQGHSSYFELIAARNALNFLAKRYSKKHITVVSDSTYVVNGINDLTATYRRLVRKNSRKPLDAELFRLWGEITYISTILSMSAVHVKGHNDQTLNMACDKLCTYIYRHPETCGKIDGLQPDVLVPWILSRKLGGNRLPPPKTEPLGPVYWYRQETFEKPKQGAA